MRLSFIVLLVVAPPRMVPKYFHSRGTLNLSFGATTTWFFSSDFIDSVAAYADADVFTEAVNVLPEATSTPAEAVSPLRDSSQYPAI